MVDNIGNVNTQNDEAEAVSLKISGQKKDEASDNSNNYVQKSKFGKVKKRKKPKDLTAPRQPLTGYIRYLNDRRESVRSANPNLPFAEITRILASEWSSLATDKKQHYLDAAVQDRERYTKEYNAYKQSQAYKNYTDQIKEKETKGIQVESENTSCSTVIDSCGKDFDIEKLNISIFTEQFVVHNKLRDAELNQLRKTNIDYEEKNTALQKHIENVKSAIESLETEIMKQRNNNVSLNQQLDHLRSTLTNGFSNVKLPDEVPTLQTIDSYMSNLYSMLLENSSQDTTLVKTVKDIVARLEFNG